MAQTAATQVQVPIPLGSLVHQLYKLHSQSGFADKDFSSIYQMVSKSTK
ncbi:unnamed protein product [Protopolystoma xenopodis]|uniref:Uncharacterized protein n=1 Tax=Protopolystoma xenopodis TaxID=117903 RepID=A0A3S5ASR4_9PLAT|nr:unnamed protein product [Protopolystoma xenopodis]